MVVAEQEAGLVESLIDRGEHEAAPASQGVHLLTFRGGKGELLRKMLLQDAEFQPLRQSLQNKGLPLVLQPSGAIVLVLPEQYLDVVSSLESHTLKRYKVAIAESLEYLMDEVLVRLSSKQRPREHRCERQEVDLCPRFTIRRTFICDAPRLLQPGTVAQFTTEAVRSSQRSHDDYFAHIRGLNPRRHALGRGSERRA